MLNSIRHLQPAFWMRGLLATASLLVLCGCAATVAVEPAIVASTCAVPAGHEPPPGQCRIWYPELPPGQQPPPGDCYALEARVPLNACLVYND